MSQQHDYQLADLLTLMTRLRDPLDGCPWDIQQSYKSIAPSTIEEAYEVVDAIEQEDFDQLREELGDLLFQVIFYSELAREESRFEFADVASDLVTKLVRRHPTYSLTIPSPVVLVLCVRQSKRQTLNSAGRPSSSKSEQPKGSVRYWVMCL